MQVSRLGNPLFNEVIVPMARKDEWNSTPPDQDTNFAQYVPQPELGKLLPLLYPGVFPNLARATPHDRADLVAILLTGIPAGDRPGLPELHRPTLADQLRLNVAIPPAPHPNVNGILGGDLAGFPNGRRVFDDVVTIELRAVAGATIPLVDPTFTPDAAASQIMDGSSAMAPRRWRRSPGWRTQSAATTRCHQPCRRDDHPRHHDARPHPRRRLAPPPQWRGRQRR